MSWGSCSGVAHHLMTFGPITALCITPGPVGIRMSRFSCFDFVHHPITRRTAEISGIAQTAFAKLKIVPLCKEVGYACISAFGTYRNFSRYTLCIGIRLTS